MEAAQHLTVMPEEPIEGFDGEPTPENFRRLLVRIRELELRTQELEKHERELERELKGKRLAIHRLEADREADALAMPERPQVEALHRLWKRACNRRRPLHFTDYENIGRAVRKLGFDTCCRAIAGAAFDPHTRLLKNGRTERYDDLELIFRQYAKVKEFARRAPVQWTPNPDRIAEIGKADLADVRQWLGVSE